MPTEEYNPDKYFTYHQQTLTKLVKYLENEQGIHSREDLLDKTDDHATARDFANVWDGVGPKMAALLVHLRGVTIAQWRKMTGLPAFNDAAKEEESKASNLLDLGIPNPITATPQE